MLKINRSISRSIFATIDRGCRRTRHWNDERHCVTSIVSPSLYFFFRLSLLCPSFRKISLCTCLKTRRFPRLLETRPYNAHGIFIIHKFTFLSNRRKAPLQP